MVSEDGGHLDCMSLISRSSSFSLSWAISSCDEEGQRPYQNESPRLREPPHPPPTTTHH